MVVPVISVGLTRAEGNSGFLVRMSGFPACTQYPRPSRRPATPPSWFGFCFLDIQSRNSRLRREGGECSGGTEGCPQLRVGVPSPSPTDRPAAWRATATLLSLGTLRAGTEHVP